MTARTQKSKPQIINPVFTDADLGKYNSIIKLSLFHFYDFFDWWYVRMPILYMLQFRRILVVLNDQLSISLLFRTFFVPWHRDSKPIGYLMGIVMRILYLPIALTIYIFTAVISMLLFLFWIFLPMLTIIFIIITPII